MHLHDQSAQMIRRKDEVRYNQINRTNLFDPETKLFLCSSRVRDTHTHLQGTHSQKHMHTYIHIGSTPTKYAILYNSSYVSSYLFTLPTLPPVQVLNCHSWDFNFGIHLVHISSAVFLSSSARSCAQYPAGTNMLQHQPKGYPILIIIVPLLRSWLSHVFSWKL